MKQSRDILSPSILLILILLCSCASHKPLSYPPKPSYRAKQIGIASWYGSDFHGKKTSSGEIYNMYDLTAAHKTLPLGTYVRVTNLNNKRSAKVKINDRGPFIKGRIIDLSYTAAKKIDMVESGTAKVKVEILKKAKVQDIPYTLQVGSFKEKRNAFKLKKELDSRYKDVYIITSSNLPAVYYRVRIGHFKSDEKAIEAAKRLRMDGYTVFQTRSD
ncbi:MAG: septal ring lytic transglycosylase RlpA family protein [Thermodesulfobacteriota bacterium]|nr:septal ring lytic transglycosylase RlpA family protein [Thermodesulfobacteriota bacterium]